MTEDGIKKLTTNNLTCEKIILQAVIVEYFEEMCEYKQKLEARIMVSDGIHGAMACIHPKLFDNATSSQEHIPIKRNDIIAFTRVETTFIEKDGRKYPVIVPLEPYEVVYKNIDVRIGQPK